MIIYPSENAINDYCHIDNISKLAREYGYDMRIPFMPNEVKDLSEKISNYFFEHPPIINPLKEEEKKILKDTIKSRIDQMCLRSEDKLLTGYLDDPDPTQPSLFDSVSSYVLGYISYFTTNYSKNKNNNF